MSYQVTLNSRNVLVPLSLEDGRGERMSCPLSKLDAATALVIQVGAEGGFTQEFIPLRIGQDIARSYAGTEWELWSQRAGSDLHAYYLGIPDRFFAADADGRAPRSLSVEVVGTSPLTGREDFSGGVDVTLLEQVAPPLIPGFMNLSGRFFPALLPHNFIERHVLEVFEFAGRRQPVLMTALQMDSADRLPVSLGKHWEPKNWIQAVVENLVPSRDGYFAIKGGCFYGRNRKITHWFGGDIGLEEPGFREAATEKIRAMGQSGNGAWVFWLEPQGDGADALLRDPAASALRRISIRHPMMHKLLRHRGNAPARKAESPLAEVDAGEAVAALSHMARVLLAHQDTLLNAQAEPSHADWSERRSPMTEALEALAVEEAARRPAPEASARPAGLESDIGELYRTHGETLRALESIFDETYGYSAWDAVGNPMRETLSAYLVENADPAAQAAVRAPS